VAACRRILAARRNVHTAHRPRARRARTQAASLLQEETEKHFSAERAPLKGAHATRIQTDDGTTYDDFRVALPDSSLQFPVGLSENPFTGETLDRYGARVPSTMIGPDLLVRNLSVDGVFPALYHYYAEHSLGTLTLQNTGASTITDLSVQLNVPGLMKTPTDAPAPTALGVGQSVDVSIRAVFDPSVLDRNQGGTVSAEISITYSESGKTYADTIRRPIGLLNRNAMRWTDDLKVGAFMSTDDPALLRWTGQIMGMGADLATNVLTRNLFSAVRMFEAMKATGLRYVVDPASPYESVSRDSTAIAFLKFPMETVDTKAGQCDDLSVLYDSLLESVGVSTAYITTPGHIFAAFDLGMSPETASKSFAKAEDLIIRDGVVWVPVETTMVDEGFTKAWQTAAVEWREATNAGTAGFFTAKDAWKLYLPAGFFGVASAARPCSRPGKRSCWGRWQRPRPWPRRTSWESCTRSSDCSQKRWSILRRPSPPASTCRR
jgi:hypothetical protein